MICKKCGREISDQAKFCTYCGATVVVDAGADEVGADAADAAAAAVANAAATGADATVGAVDGYAAEAAPEPSAYSEPAPSAHDAPPPAYDTAQQPAPYDDTALPTEAPTPYDAPPAPYGDAAPPADAPAHYGAPVPAPPADAPAPYGAPLPAPAPAPYGAPQARYDSAQSPQPRKSKAGLMVGIIVAVVVVLGAAVAVGGYFIYQGWVADTADTQTTTTGGPKTTTDPKTTPDPGAQPTPEPDPTVPPDSNDGPAPKSLADFKNPYVALDTPELKITIDVGSGTTQDSIVFYEVYCIVENKSDKTLFFSLEDASGDGFLGDEFDVFLLRDYLSYDSDDWDFTPGESLARLNFSLDKVDKRITNFKAKLVAYDAESYQEFATYDLEIPEL